MLLFGIPGSTPPRALHDSMRLDTQDAITPKNETKIKKGAYPPPKVPLVKQQHGPPARSSSLAHSMHIAKPSACPVREPLFLSIDITCITELVQYREPSLRLYVHRATRTFSSFFFFWHTSDAVH